MTLPRGRSAHGIRRGTVTSTHSRTTSRRPATDARGGAGELWPCRPRRPHRGPCRGRVHHPHGRARIRRDLRVDVDDDRCRARVRGRAGRPGLLVCGSGGGDAHRRAADPARGGPGCRGHEHGLDLDGRGGAKPGTAGHRRHGDLGGRHSRLGSQGQAPRPAARRSPRPGARPRARVRQWRLHLVYRRGAPRPAGRLGRCRGPRGQAEGRPRSSCRSSPRGGCAGRRRPGRRRHGRRQRRAGSALGPARRGGVCGAAGDVVRGAGVVRRYGWAAVDPRPHARPDGGHRRRVRVGSRCGSRAHHHGRRRRGASRRDALHGGHGVPARQRAVRGVPRSAVGALRPVDPPAADGRGATSAEHGMVPRPRPHRAPPVRRRTDSDQRLARARRGRAGVRAGPARGRRRPVSRVELRVTTRTTAGTTPPTRTGIPTPTTWRAPFVDVEAKRGRPAAASAGDVPSDAERLVVDLLNEVRGEVRFDAGSRALYATDASNYRQVPIGVVVPRDTDDVIAAIDVCRAHRVPVVSRGGGTSLAGQTCNVAVVLDHSKFNNGLLELNADEGWARVRPGIVLDELRDAAEAHHLTFGPDPATHSHCTLGGMLGNNSCGVHSVMAGKTVDNVLELDVLCYDGTRLRAGPTPDDELIRLAAQPGRVGDLYRGMRQLRDDNAAEIRARYPDIPRRVSGYNLDQLLPEHRFDVARALVGSESTLVTILEAKVRLVPSPPGRTLVPVGYPDVFAAADDVPAVVASACIACEGMDDKLVRDVRSRGIHPDALRLLPDGRGFLLVEFGGSDRRESDERAHAFVDDLARRNPAAAARCYDDPADEAKLWKVRESGLGVTAMVPGKPTSGPGWEDSAVPPDQLGDYLRAVGRLWAQYGYDADMYGHFGQGVLHCRIDFDLVTAKGLRDFRAYMDDAADLVVRMGGSLSGEHGDGQARAELLPKMFGDRIVGAFETFKDLWDPDGLMNPGKIVRPNPILSDLRLGTDYRPARPRTVFAYPDDNGEFGHAAFRCVGVGECRRHDGGVMCPSYMV